MTPRIENNNAQKELFINFADKIALSDHSFSQRLVRLLEARGFLLEYQNENISLSDNSYLVEGQDLNDSEFLDRLLRQKGIGYVDNLDIKITSECNMDDLGELFLQHGGCSGFGYSYSDWTNFVRRLHAQKIPVYLLDPFVARFVKAISSIGVWTHYSCDGHGKNQIKIGLAGKYNAAWFMTVLKSFLIKNTGGNCLWNLTKQGYLEISNPNNNVLGLYEEIQIVAEFFYSRRILLRQIKVKCMGGLNEQDVSDLSVNQIIKVFWDRSNENLLA